ncbi:hypothetical protein AHAS_Ahas20G0159700 [Arachis hypogaea]
MVEAERIPYTCICCNFFIKILLPSLVQPGLNAPPSDKVTIFGVFVKENDVAAFTISTVDEPRTLNKVLYLRPSENIYSLNELVEMTILTINTICDARIFLRGENGESRLGIRRAVRPRNGLPESIVGNQSCYPNFLSSVANAISAKSMFHVFYSPRATHADFVVSYKKCTSGIVTGMSDLDPYRWPKSKWRCLMVLYLKLIYFLTGYKLIWKRKRHMKLPSYRMLCMQ